MLALELRCTTCRDGWVCCELWEAWYARRAELEEAWVAAHGSLDGLEQSPAAVELREAEPDCETEMECTDCRGVGTLPGEGEHSAA